MVVDRPPLSEPVKQIELPYRVYVTEFSPFEWSANLLALGLEDSVLIGQIKLPEEEGIEVRTIRFTACVS